MADKPAAPANGPATGAGDGAAGDALDALDAALASDEGGAAEGAEAEEWTPPTREEWQAQQDAHKAALEAEKGKLQRARTQAERLRKEKGAAPADSAAPADAPATAQLAALQQRAEAAERRAVVAAARVQLTQRGADGDLLDLAVSRLNVAEVTFDGDEPELDSWLDEMEERYPKLFLKAEPATPTTPQRPAGGVNQGSAATRQTKHLSYAQQVIANSGMKRR